MRMERTRYIPKDSIPLEFADIPAVVYVHGDIHNKPCVIAYSHKRTRHDFNNIFLSTDQAQRKILAWAKSLREVKQLKAVRNASKKGLTHNLKASDILHGSWGYDQTNCEYWQVVSLSKSGKTVKIQEIAAQTVPDSEGFMSCSLTPVKDQFLNDTVKSKRVQLHQNNDGEVSVSIKLHESCYLSPWSGGTNYSSWYA